ncbi:hypothetical protein PGIGA_G00056050 [Pangasianodon gigas]|uniref:Uncharacterized protein n=1 Tax=Pangasianodon gigas TaxID=30993 RepID=A0ACC5X4G0_PANGG|nr:hypothetical protein [Pangasianodon gigas]
MNKQPLTKQGSVKSLVVRNERCDPRVPARFSTRGLAGCSEARGGCEQGFSFSSFSSLQQIIPSHQHPATDLASQNKI